LDEPNDLFSAYRTAMDGRLHGRGLRALVASRHGGTAQRSVGAG